MEGGEVVAAVLALAALAGAHLVPPALTFVRFTPRSWMLSAAGGVSVGYVFVHLLPEVAEAQVAVDERATGVLADVERHAYVTALVGLVVFYGLERAALTSRHRSHPEVDLEEPTSPGAFWLSTVSFALYNGVIGYLVVERSREADPSDLLLFVVALSLHFVINDLALREHHRRRYDRYGRPILTAAIAAGWLVGLGAEVSEAALGLIIAFLGGGVVLNVIKEEVPQERESRFVPFALGAVAYTLLLLAA